MQALHINWLARSRNITPVGLVLGVAALLCTAVVAQDYLQADAEWQSLQSRQARQAKLGQSPKRTAVSTVPLARDDAQSAAQIDAQLQRPWNALLHALERTTSKDVALVSADLQAAGNSVHLTAEAKDMEHALAYVKKLRQAPELSRVYLTGQEEKLSGTQKVVRFTLDANWGATP